MQNAKITIQDLGTRRLWGYPEIQSFFLALRQLLESEQDKSRYKTLQFYCNWCAHLSIKKSLVGYRMLESINAFWDKIISDPFTDDYDEKVQSFFTDLFSLTHLKIEVLLLLAVKSVEPIHMMTRPENFPIFTDALLHFLQDKPVSFPGPPFHKGSRQDKEIFDGIVNRARIKDREHVVCIALELSKHELLSWLGNISIKLTFLKAPPLYLNGIF